MKHSQCFTLMAGVCALLISTSSYANCSQAIDPAALDNDGSGTLSRIETLNTPLSKKFHSVDNNGDGFIDQMEYRNRCSSASSAHARPARNSANKPASESAWEGTVADDKVDRQTQRQSNKINQRVDQETDQAVDSFVDKAMDSLFN